MTANYINPRQLVHTAEYEGLYNMKLARCPFCACSSIALYVSKLPHMVCMGCQAEGPLQEVLGDGRDAANWRAGHQWNIRVVA